MKCSISSSSQFVEFVEKPKNFIVRLRFWNFCIDVDGLNGGTKHVALSSFIRGCIPNTKPNASTVLRDEISEQFSKGFVQAIPFVNDPAKFYGQRTEGAYSCALPLCGRE